MFNKIKEIFKIQIVRFVICACIYNVIGILMYWMLLVVMNYVIANAISAFIAIIFAYLLNTKYVFEQKYQLDNFVKFITVYFSNLIFSTCGLILLVEVLGINEFIASPLMICVNVMYNFLLTKYWALRGKNG